MDSLEGGEIRISKSALPSLPEGYERTRLGEARGSRRQFRSASGVHVREYDDDYAIHVDRVDPRKNALGHLIFDSPGTLVSLGAGLVAARAADRSHGRRRTTFSGGLGFIFAFVITDALVRFLKRLFLG